MKISIIHPSRGRPEQAIQTVKNWIDKADDKEFEYLLICDSDDPLIYKYHQRTDFPVHNNHKSAIEAINSGAKRSTGDILIIVSDDFDCPEHWDTLLLEALKGKSDLCVKTSDGIQPFIITLPIMDRTYYNRFGYVYNPEYAHMFADLEMSCVAHGLGKYLKVDMEFKHNHYTALKQKPDAINIKNNRTWRQGQNTFMERHKINFGIDPVNDIPTLNELHKHFIKCS